MQNKEKSLTQTAYSYIKSQILSCALYPGSAIKEKVMLDEIGLSRTPFREALLQLQQENLVEIRPRSGIFVKEITKSDILEVYSIRKIIEPSAVIANLLSIDQSRMLELHETWKNSLEKEKDPLTLCNLDLQFHSFFIQSTGNARLIAFFQTIMQEAYRISVFNAKEHKSLEPFYNTSKQHQRIIDAIMNENEEDIKNSFRFHMNYFLSSASNCVK